MVNEISMFLSFTRCFWCIHLLQMSIGWIQLEMCAFNVRRSQNAHNEFFSGCPRFAYSIWFIPLAKCASAFKNKMHENLPQVYRSGFVFCISFWLLSMVHLSLPLPNKSLSISCSYWQIEPYLKVSVNTLKTKWVVGCCHVEVIGL